MPYLINNTPYEDTEHALAAKRCHEPAARLRCDSKCAVSHTSAMRWCAFAAATQSSQSSIAAAAILRVARYLQISSFSSSFSLAESSPADQLRSKHGRLPNFEDRRLSRVLLQDIRTECHCQVYGSAIPAHNPGLKPLL